MFFSFPVDIQTQSFRDFYKKLVRSFQAYTMCMASGYNYHSRGCQLAEKAPDKWTYHLSGA